jgi:hypothetical protein
MGRNDTQVDHESVTVTALTIVEQLTPMQLFAPEHLNPILERIKAEARAFKPDISTEAGRKELRAVVKTVVGYKTFIEGQGKDLVEETKRRVGVIDDD